MEKPIIVKSEVQTNGDIFLYYVDENGTPMEHEDGVVTTIVEDQLQQLQENYILEEIPLEQEHETVENYHDMQEIVENNIEVVGSNEETTDFTSFKEQWSEEEIKKLLIFYIDNKKAFKNGSFTKRYLWSVACQMTLTSKNAATCQVQLHKMKQKYEHLYLKYATNKVDPRGWLYYDLCHKAFHDDIEKTKVEVTDKSDQVLQVIEKRRAPHPPTVQLEQKQADGTPTFRNKKFKKAPDEKVALMLEILLQNKKELSRKSGAQKNVWEKIALQLGESAEYVHKKFLNYKRHYICMLEKKSAGGEVDWPYMAWFDNIFKDDHDFQRKYGAGAPKPVVPVSITNNITKVTSLIPLTTGNPVVKATVVQTPAPEWNETEKTVLVKYHYDCFDEFQDPTVPKAFLWNEVGRLLDKQPEDCKNKYEKLKHDHLSQYTHNGYNLQKRKPIAIMFDNIIAQEVEAKFYDPVYQAVVTDLKWRAEKIDRLVNFFLDNIELFKDPICHFVCWSAVAIKLGETVKACKDVWNDLTSLYKSILDDKKEDPDLQIDWRYIDIFDTIFDYGLDTKLLEGYENKVTIVTRHKRIVLATGKQFKVEEDSEVLSDMEVVDIDDNKLIQDKQTGTRAVKLLEYYMKNKDRVSTTLKNKNEIWLGIAPDLKMTLWECGAMFRRLKQIYVSHIQREISNPEKPVLWPHYALCKKAFGYRVIKNKLKNAKRDPDNKDEWTPKEIKMLINFAGQNLSVIEADLNNASLWSVICKDINKSDTGCRDMFLQLRKSYWQTQKVMRKNPERKVNWKYFKLFQAIYNEAPEGIVVDSEESMATRDDEYQCIIVIPDGQELSELELEQAKIVITDTSNENTSNSSSARILWSKQHKMDLLNAYQEYVKANEGKLINTRKLWKVIGKKLNRKPMSCQRKYKIIKNQYEKLKNEGIQGNRKIKNSPCFSLLENIMQMKPKMVRPPLTANDIVLSEQATYTDISLPLWSVEKALTYYLEHVKEFVNPKYDKKQAWMGLAKASSLPVSKAFKKINYLKQSYNTIKQEHPTECGDIIKEIIEKEFICKLAIGDITDPLATNENTDEVIWSDRDTELLLFWYLEHRELFKDPKYNKNYLWLEVPSILNKSPLACSRKMAEIRSQYSSMAKENPDALSGWKYYDLCQKIYGTGKKGTGE